ncbi:MAG: hypothetical protein AAGA54_00735 [Myxococcota bacterium]
MYRALAIAVVGLLTVGSGCSVDTGVVEWAWAFIDENGDAIYPSGVFDVSRTSACGLPGRTASSNVAYDLGVELAICDPTCTEGCEDPDCQIVAPLEFGCDRSRGSNPSVPSSDAPYQFTISPVISLPGGDECRDMGACISAPGPRERVVAPGLVTDLQVFQLIVGVDQGGPSSGSGALDLEACGCS